MRTLQRLAWAATFAALSGSPAFAQQIGTGGGLGTGGQTGGGGTGGGGFGGALGNQNQSGAGGTQLLTPETAPMITAPSNNTANSNTAIQQSNAFQKTYGNVMYQGRPGAATNLAPGGFGSPLYSNTGAAAGGGARTATTGAGGRGGLGGANSSQDPGGIVVPLPRQISYSSQIQFKAPPVVQGALFNDIRGTIDRSTFLTNPRGVEVIVAEGNVVVLRGQVADEDEARGLEGMVRLTPGVRDVRNELSYPPRP